MSACFLRTDAYIQLSIHIDATDHQVGSFLANAAKRGNVEAHESFDHDVRVSYAPKDKFVLLAHPNAVKHLVDVIGLLPELNLMI